MRRSWFEAAPEPDSPDGKKSMLFEGSASRRESWKRAMEDGRIEAHEVAEQKNRILALLRELEPMLDDTQHAKVTEILEEYAVLQSMNGTLLLDELVNGLDSFQAAVPPDEAPEL